MSADKGWGQTLLIGAGVVAAAGALWYLYTTSESSPRADYQDSSDEEEQPAYTQQAKTTSKSARAPEAKPEAAEQEPEAEPLKNRLPPLPERPTASKRRAVSNKSSPASTSTKDESKAAKSSEQHSSTDPEPDTTAVTSEDDSENEAEADKGDEDPVLDWFQTRDEVIILLLVSDSAKPQHVHYKLKPTHLEVKENGVTLVQADLPFPVQVEDSNWQFDHYQGMRVISITLQKADGDSGYADWPHWKQ